jgi:hypothetical protein
MIFKNKGKKFKKTKRLKATIREQAKEIERLTGEKKVMRQEIDRITNDLQKV